MNSSVEAKLLKLLETRRRKGERFTIAQFVRDAGYANRSALRRFPTLKKELYDYCVSQHGVRGLPKPSEWKALEHHNKQLRLEADALERRLDELPRVQERLMSTVQEAVRLKAENGALRALVSAVVSHMAQRNLRDASELEDMLRGVALQLVPEAGQPMPGAEASVVKPLRRAVRRKPQV